LYIQKEVAECIIVDIEGHDGEPNNQYVAGDIFGLVLGSYGIPEIRFSQLLKKIVSLSQPGMHTTYGVDLAFNDSQPDATSAIGLLSRR